MILTFFSFVTAAAKGHFPWSLLCKLAADSSPAGNFKKVSCALEGCSDPGKIWVTNNTNISRHFRVHHNILMQNVEKKDFDNIFKLADSSNRDAFILDAVDEDLGLGDGRAIRFTDDLRRLIDSQQAGQQLAMSQSTLQRFFPFHPGTTEPSSADSRVR